ncbi:hypothetical protein [Rhodococcus sp. BP22]|uniref:hypothetical protein n=1 Tax=Rhodococcus sp. BP22 TaxID=2758566 RepID=UPI0016451C85|nr:hypothetical protein [Rhodococcus sp. BP22]
MSDRRHRIRLHPSRQVWFLFGWAIRWVRPAMLLGTVLDELEAHPGPLRTHHTADVPRSQIGLPEVLLGVLPGAGSVARTVRLIGIQRGPGVPVPTDEPMRHRPDADGGQ